MGPREVLFFEPLVPFSLRLLRGEERTGGFLMEKLCLKIAKRLISIPSYLGGDCDEVEIGEFIYQYLKENCPYLKVIKQSVQGRRFNVIARDNYPCRVLWTGHIDTVQPRSGWKSDPFKPKVRSGKLYGLGATDMKGSIAAMLRALAGVKTKGWMFLFYCDEEYDFLGTKRFIQKYKDKLRPRLIISGDGGLEIGNSCRGLIEIWLKVRGKTGHASRPKSGINAISGLITAIEQLSGVLKKNYSSKELGTSTCNLAYIQGGLDLGVTDRVQVYGREGNNIADLAEAVIDIRSASLKLDAKTIIRKLKQLLNQKGLILEEFKIRHDFGCWITPKSKLSEYLILASKYFKVSFQNPVNFGYIDTQMLWESFNKPVCFTLGAGNFAIAHKGNEYVEVKNIEVLEQFYFDLLNLLKGGEKNE